MFDMFGQEISFTWNGEEQFKTGFGATVTLILFAVLISFGGLKANDLFKKKNPIVSRTNILRAEPAVNQTLSYDPQIEGFDFSFSLTEQLDAKIGFFTVREVTRVTQNGQTKKSQHDLKFSKCGVDNFNFSDTGSIKQFGIDKSLCLENDYILEGQSFYNTNLKYLEIKLFKCLNTTLNRGLRQPSNQNVTCKPQSEIDKHFNDETFSLPFVNHLFQFDNFDTPLRSFIDDSLFFNIDVRVRKNANFYIQRSQINVQDDIWLGKRKNFTFPQVSNIKVYDDNYSDDDGGQLVSVYLRFDKSYDLYERKVSDVLSLMAEIGGLHKALFAIGMIVVSFVAQKVFMSNLVRRIYQERKYENLTTENLRVKDDDDEGDMEEKPALKTTPTFSPEVQDQVDKGQLPQSWVFRVKEYVLHKAFRHTAQIQEPEMQSVFFALLSRKRFNYSINQIKQYFLACMCLRDVNKMKGVKGRESHFLFAKAEQKLKNELDVVRIVKTMRQLKNLAQAMLSQKHRLLLKFQRSNLVETSSSSSDSDDNMFDELKLIENKDPWVKLSTYGKMKKKMSKFEGKQISELEQNLFRGLFIRKLKDFAEETRKDGKKTLLERFTQDNTSFAPSFVADQQVTKRPLDHFYSINPTIQNENKSNYLTIPTEDHRMHHRNENFLDKKFFENEKLQVQNQPHNSMETSEAPQILEEGPQIEVDHLTKNLPLKDVKTFQSVDERKILVELNDNQI